MVESWLSDRVTKSNKLQQEFQWPFHSSSKDVKSMSPLEPTWSSSSRCVASVVLAAREFALKPFAHFETALPIAVS